MRFGGLLPLGVNPRADQPDGDQLITNCNSVTIRPFTIFLIRACVGFGDSDWQSNQLAQGGQAMNICSHFCFVYASAALALLFGAAPLLAQSKGSEGRATPPGKEAPVSTSPNDPTSHNPMRPNQYDMEYSRLGSHSEVEAMLKAGNEA